MNLNSTEAVNVQILEVIDTVAESKAKCQNAGLTM